MGLTPPHSLPHRVRSAGAPRQLRVRGSRVELRRLRRLRSACQAEPARLVWVIDPERRLARIYRHDGSESILGEADVLEGEDNPSGIRLQTRRGCENDRVVGALARINAPC